MTHGSIWNFHTYIKSVIQSTNDNLDSRGKVNKSELPNVQNSERIRKKKILFYSHFSVPGGEKSYQCVGACTCAFAQPQLRSLPEDRCCFSSRLSCCRRLPTRLPQQQVRWLCPGFRHPILRKLLEVKKESTAPPRLNKRTNFILIWILVAEWGHEKRRLPVGEKKTQNLEVC